MPFSPSTMLRRCKQCGRKMPIRKGCRNDYRRYGGRQGSGTFMCHECANEIIEVPQTIRIVPDKDGMVRVLPQVKK